MADIEVPEADIQELSDGGFLVVVTDDETPLVKRLAVEDVAAGVALAATAVQPGDIGTAAAADVEDFASAAEVGDIAAALAAILGGGD